MADGAESSGIAAVLFDYGLVLTGPPHPLAWERMRTVFGATESAFGSAYWQHRPDYDRGALSGQRYWEAVGHDLHHPFSQTDVSTLLEADTELWTQPNQPMVDWAAQLRGRGIRTGILSNLGDAMEAGVRSRFDWLQRFHHHTFSHRLGTVKPDPTIYAYAARGLGVEPANILFIDDRQENVEGALAAGMRAVQYRDHDQFLAAMHSLGFADLLSLPGAPAEAATDLSGGHAS